MSVKLWTAALAAVWSLAAAAPGSAADLDPYAPPPAAYGAPYDDPRYSDIYRHPPPRRYVERYDERSYVPPPPPPYAYRSAPRPEAYGAYGCRPHEAVRAGLERQGWYDVHTLQPGGDVVHVRARRASGAVYELVLERCSGQILDRRFVTAQTPPATYAWRQRGDVYRRY